MAPKQEFVSTIGFKVPKNRNETWTMTSDKWLEAKRENDGAEGLWRVHDDLYDLTDFVSRHPGGSMWLELTKGTDITEAFETHHITKKSDNMLPKFHVRKAETPRNSPFSFHEEGFYKQLKQQIREALPNVPEWPATRTKIFTDFLFVVYLISAILCAVYQSYFIGTLSGMLLTCLTIASHNYFHQKDGFRMYYFDLSLMSSREWRISHALSHHLFTNTIIDLEIQMFEPMFQYLPVQKSLIYKYFSWFCSPIVYVTLFPVSYIKRLITTVKVQKIDFRDLIPLTVPVLMCLLSEATVFTSFKLWGWIILVGSFQFTLIGLNAAHHSPDIFHDGDAPRTDTKDWGVAQLDTVMDRFEINKSNFLVLTTFGEHGLHHLFPTIDHGKLPYLYPVFKEVCERFGVKLRMASQLTLAKGQFMQLARSKPNPSPPQLKKEL